MIERRKGTYISCKYTKETENSLQRWCRANDVISSVNLSDYHSTIVHSRKELEILKLPTWGIKHKIKATGFHLFASDKGIEYRSLAILLDAPKLQEFHKELIANGATHDFPDYTPHVTVSYYANKDTDLTKLWLPDFELEIYGIMVCPLDLNWESSV